MCPNEGLFRPALPLFYQQSPNKKNHNYLFFSLEYSGYEIRGAGPRNEKLTQRIFPSPKPPFEPQHCEGRSETKTISTRCLEKNRACSGSSQF